MKRSEMVSCSHIFRFPAKPERKMAIKEYNSRFCGYYEPVEKPGKPEKREGRVCAGNPGRVSCAI